MKRFSKRLMAILLALLIVFSAFPLNAFAAKFITDMNSDAVFGVISGSYDDYGHELHYAKYDGSTYITFCCEYGVKSPTGTTYEYGKDFKKYVNRNDAKYQDIAKYIAFGYTLLYGDGLPSTKKEKIAACCTQQYVWERLGVNPSRSSWNSTYMSNDLYKEWKSDTDDRIAEYYDTHISFDGSAKTINLGGSTTVTDSNGVLKYYPTFSKTVNKVTFSHTKGENKMTINVASDCTTHSVSFNSASYKIFRCMPDGSSYDEDTMNYVYFEFESGDVQDLMFSHYVDPETFKINVNVTFGNIQITKTSEDNIVSGMEFTVTGGGNTYTMTTNSKGIATLNNIPIGTYTISEKGITRYVVQADKKATVTDGATANVTFENELKKGELKIIKHSEDNIVSGFTFSITASDGNSYSATTNSSGVATLKNIPVYDKNNEKIVYTVKETDVPIRYYTPDKKTVTLTANKTSEVTIDNTTVKGNLRIEKVCEDKLKEGLKFSVSGSDGKSYTATTNASGVATVNDIPVYDSNNKKIVYTVKEIDVPIRYVAPDNQETVLLPDKTTTLNFENDLKKFRVKVVKEDIEKGKAQGDSSLAGATYGLYKGDTLMASYTTDSNASFITDYFICADDWTIKEISSSEGYLVNSKAYKVGAKPELYTVEYNTTDNKVQEQVIKGNIAIIKHSDDGSTQIETPEKNAEFQIYLKSSGSYAKADSDERDTLICDEDGFASSKLLPYGVYTVHQTKGWDGREKIKDFDVYINKDGKTYKFLINNANFCSYLKVVKNDKETNKPIAYAGAAFEIFDDEGHRITMQYTYPKVTSIHTFYTNSEGYLITPEMLPYGEYTLVEVQAPYGYVLDDTPIPFSIKQENSSTDTGVTVVKVNAKDMAQKGVIEITKTGEIFSTINENENIYTPVYETGNLKNAVFQVYAGEDIYTLDGTLRAYNGELVDEITTGTNGVAKSKELYLGKYVVIEKTAPENYINNNEQYNVELEYAGQNVSVTSTALSVYNERQKVQLSLLKTMERNEIYNIGNNNEILSVQFGIYAGEDIKAADGSVIPTDSLITFANCDKDGNIAFSCDLPIGFKWYAKEIATDEHYIISDTKYDFATKYQGESVSVIDIIINNGEVILNNLKYGQLNGLKVDDDGNALAGALIGIFTPNTKEFTKDNAIQTVTSGDDGTFYFYNVPYGEWIVREIIAPTGYVLDTTQHHIYITDNDVSITMLIENKLIKGDLEISKTDVSSGEALANVGFRIYDADKNIIAEGITDNDGKCTFENLRYGDYFYQEYSCDDAYILDDSLYPFSISEDGVIVKAEMTNRMKQGSIVIHKTDASTGKALANVGFRIYDADKNIIAEGKTDKNGNCTFENLVYGTYYYQEYSCDSKYALDDTLYKFVISEDGQIVKAEMTNELKPVPMPPKTADESNKRTLLTIISASALALLGVAYAYLRKRKQEPTTDEGGNDNEC